MLRIADCWLRLHRCCGGRLVTVATRAKELPSNVPCDYARALNLPSLPHVLLPSFVNTYSSGLLLPRCTANPGFPAWLGPGSIAGARLQHACLCRRDLNSTSGVSSNAIAFSQFAGSQLGPQQPAAAKALCNWAGFTLEHSLASSIGTSTGTRTRFHNPRTSSSSSGSILNTCGTGTNYISSGSSSSYSSLGQSKAARVGATGVAGAASVQTGRLQPTWLHIRRRKRQLKVRKMQAAQVLRRTRRAGPAAWRPLPLRLPSGQVTTARRPPRPGPGGSASGRVWAMDPPQLTAALAHAPTLATLARLLLPLGQDPAPRSSPSPSSSQLGLAVQQRQEGQRQQPAVQHEGQQQRQQQQQQLGDPDGTVVQPPTRQPAVQRDGLLMRAAHLAILQGGGGRLKPRQLTAAFNQLAWLLSHSASPEPGAADSVSGSNTSGSSRSSRGQGGRGGHRGRYYDNVNSSSSSSSAMASGAQVHGLLCRELALGGAQALDGRGLSAVVWSLGKICVTTGLEPSDEAWAALLHRLLLPSSHPSSATHHTPPSHAPASFPAASAQPQGPRLCSALHGGSGQQLVELSAGMAWLRAGPAGLWSALGAAVVEQSQRQLLAGCDPTPASLSAAPLDQQPATTRAGSQSEGQRQAVRAWGPGPGQRPAAGGWQLVEPEEDAPDGKGFPQAGTDAGSQAGAGAGAGRSTGKGLGSWTRAGSGGGGEEGPGVDAGSPAPGRSLHGPGVQADGGVEWWLSIRQLALLLTSLSTGHGLLQAQGSRQQQQPGVGGGAEMGSAHCVWPIAGSGPASRAAATGLAPPPLLTPADLDCLIVAVVPRLCDSSMKDVAMTVSALEALGQANAPPPRLVRAVGEHVSRILTQERARNQATGRHPSAERDDRDARVVLGWLYKWAGLLWHQGRGNPAAVAVRLMRRVYVAKD
ncbi:hypothetical protein QJQ45_018039 [Haematococcus lacustris]|nr:hypothetical protein QJQ45_018039 [Haematococcus lacustris]